MNKIDYENIKKEIASRTVNYEKGGELSIEYIQNQEISTLQKMLKDYDNNEQRLVIDYLKRLVDDVFDKYGDEKNNMIVLESVRTNSHGIVKEDPMELVFVNYDWNKYAHPVGMEWMQAEYDDVFEDYNVKVDYINKVLRKLNVDNAKKIFANNDSVDECWFGVTAITRDYKYVNFIFRNDGILLNNEICTYKTF